MFGRFFKNKEDGGKGGPPGHRHSQPGAVGGAAMEEPTGGGFFNLPPPVAKPASTQALGAGGNGVPGANGAPGYTNRPQTAPTYSSSSYGNAPEPAAGGGGDMFGGMALKAPAGGASTYQPAQYGGGYGGPQPPATAAAPATGSLFSGLDVAAGGAAAGAGLTLGHEAPSPAGASAMLGNNNAERRRTPSQRTGSFNYLDVAGGGAASANVGAAGASMRGSAGSATSSVSSRSSSKVVRKKKKSFRPGFGRQLSDESIAALQRGDLTEDEILQQQQQGTGRRSSTERSDSQRMPSNPTDLAHLLPPVTSGSVLSGLTVHTKPATGVLTGLTVHKSSGSPKASKADTARGSVLSGLHIHSTSDAETPELSPPIAEEPVAPSHVAPEKPTPPPAPVAPATPEERLLITLRDFNESALSFRESVQKQNDEENRILERKAQLANQLTQYDIDLLDVEAQQHHAVEVEDFEKADALNGTINSVKHLISLTKSDIRKVDSELAAFVKGKEKAFANQLKSTRGTLRELEKFRDDQETERSNLQMEFKKYESDESEQLQFEAERIDTEMHHVTVNLEHVAAEKLEIEQTIDEQCSSEFALQAKLKEEKEVVEEEVRELERQLKLKLDRVHEIQSAIDVAQRDIDVVRGRYSRQLKRIADREQGILKTKVEVESDGEQLVQQRDEFKERITRYESNISTIGKRITAVRKEMRAAALLASVLEVQETRRDQSIVRKRQHAAELSTLNDAVAVAEQSFTMLRNQHDEQEKSLSIHRNAIASAEAMIPRLEQEKKTAAAQRNFKEAARISKDIKALEKDRSSAEEMVEVVEMELQDLKERITKRETDFEVKKEELKSVEKQLELNSLSELWKEAKHLRSSLRRLEKCKTEGPAADDGIDFRSSALLLVQAEYDACMVQVEALEKKYDVSDPSKDEPEDESDEEEDESVDGDYHESSAVAGVGSLESGAVSNDVNTVEDGEKALEDISFKLTELEGMIETATENEDYELAAQLDEKVEVLKRRRESILALTQTAPKAEEQATHELDSEEEEEEEEEDSIENVSGEAEDHEEDAREQYGHQEFSSPVITAADNEPDLNVELENVQLRIKMLQQQIELATENEDYETAATYDAELEDLRAEEQELQELLEDQAAETEDAATSSPERTEEPAAAPAGGLFGGLGIKAHSSTSLHSDTHSEHKSVHSEHEAPGSVGTSAVGGLFGGLALNSSAQSIDSQVAPAAEGSLFGGLQLSNGSAGSKDESTGSEYAEVVDSSAVAVETVGIVTTTTTVATTTVAESPTSSRMKDSFFGERPTHELSPELVGASSATGSMFSGLQLSGGVSHSKDESAPILSIDPVDEEKENTPEANDGPAPHENERVEAEEKPASLFGGLQLSSDTTEVVETEVVATETEVVATEMVATETEMVEEKVEEEAEEEVEEAPKSAGDTPMTILELSDHSESTSRRASATPRSESEDPSESAAATATSSLFGGLSLSGVTMTSTTTTMATTSTTFVGTRGLADEDELEEKAAAP